ncbi:MAG TPA: UDP-4-amino-4,6-dideoxy-N-acetyl-beta-L-altrosamine transaminase [Solirubrobacteraceae bacterium]|nr:UDP-4-amino-4,6-dideoxy-N-acetyl-beta-L-altrosamine transaminase [Solirubrobacteraceae bacterium]
MNPSAHSLTELPAASARRTIPYGRQTVEEDDIAAVVEVMGGDWLTQGPAVSAFEQACAAVCQAPHAVAFSSGTAALHAAVHVSGLAAGRELLTSAITFAASANCGAYLGAKPTFADIDPRTWNVSAETVRAALSADTRVVVPVHFTGLPAPVAEIRAAVGPELTIIEDAAHAIGALTPAGPVGSCRHSDMAVFSFHPVKTITCGEGGMVTTRSAALAERLREFRSHGMVRDPARLERTEGGWYAEQQELGFNYRLTDMQAALGRSQLAKLERFVRRRNELAGRYRELLADAGQLELPPAAPAGHRHAHHLFVIRHRGGAPARRRLHDGLHARGVLAQVHYLPVYRHPWYRHTLGYREGHCPAAETYYSGCLSLPCFPGLTDAEQERVATAVLQLA